MNKFKRMLAAVAILGMTGIANASVVKAVNLNFASGATFSGSVTFANDFSSYSAVSGILRGYSLTSSYYNPTATDSINWVWDTTNYATGSKAFSNFLMDGSRNRSYNHWITFGYNYNANGITMFRGGYNYGSRNNVDYSDRFTTGTVSSVPEPALLTLFGLGLVGVAFIRRSSSKV